MPEQNEALVRLAKEEMWGEVSGLFDSGEAGVDDYFHDEHDAYDHVRWSQLAGRKTASVRLEGTRELRRASTLARRLRMRSLTLGPTRMPAFAPRYASLPHRPTPIAASQAQAMRVCMHRRCIA